MKIKLNHFDDEGNVVDSDFMELTEDQASDIIDHAAQFVIMLRDFSIVLPSHIQPVFDSLDESLVVADILSE